MMKLLQRQGIGKYAALQASYSAIEIVPSDTEDVPPTGLVCVGFYVTGAGDVAVTTLGGVVATFVAVPAGTIIDCAIRRIAATGTTATGLSALYSPSNR